MSQELLYWQALNRAMDIEMAADESVFTLGEGCWALWRQLPRDRGEHKEVWGDGRRGPAGRGDLKNRMSTCYAKESAAGRPSRRSCYPSAR
jgi:hypothetical protein